MSDDDPLAFPSPRIERSEWVRAADRLRAELAALRAERDGLIENNRSLANSCRTYKDERDALRAENERLTSWIDDLQSGMYVNCVYCGHRYGPGETAPVSMSDALKAHVEQCPQHPMSALRAENERLRTSEREGHGFT